MAALLVRQKAAGAPLLFQDKGKTQQQVARLITLPVVVIREGQKFYLSGEKIGGWDAIDFVKVAVLRLCDLMYVTDGCVSNDHVAVRQHIVSAHIADADAVV